MRIFVLGTGATGSLIARLLVRQGHRVTCGDRNPDRARRFLGKNSADSDPAGQCAQPVEHREGGRGSHLIVNAGPAVLNKIVLRAALRLRAHYLDMASHQADSPFHAEQLALRHAVPGQRTARP